MIGQTINPIHAFLWTWLVECKALWGEHTHAHMHICTHKRYLQLRAAGSAAFLNEQMETGGNMYSFWDITYANLWIL